MKHLDKVLAFFLILIMLCGILETLMANEKQAATQSSTEAEIARLEKDIEK